ncbi:MAG: hypothetical protein SGBAC_003690 [Bacillariaceae sp.]
MFSGFMVPPTEAAESRNSNDFSWASERGHEDRDGVEDDNSTVGESLDALGRDLGSDMRSLPSLEEGSLEASLGTLSLSKKGALPFSFLNSKKTETVESVVEKKINNLKSERSVTSIDGSVSYLHHRLQPKPPQVYNEIKKRTTPDSIVESRRHMLVRELRDAVAKYGRFDLRCANITAALGDLYDEIEDHIQAIRLHKDAVSVFSVKLGDNDQKALTARVRLGEVQENASEYDDAIATYYYVISMTRALDGEKSPKAASVAMKMAEALRKKGENELAIKTLKKVLKIYREILGDGHPKVSTVVDEIAKLYVSIGDYIKASAILEQVVKLKAATMGASDKAVADSLIDLSSCYECAEQYNKAMKNLKKAYKIQEDLEGEASDACILTLERIGVIYQATGHFKKAAIAYLGVLRGRKHALGESHPTVADTYFHLAVSLRESGQEDKAFKCMKQALNIYVGEGKNMHDVMMIAEVMHELGVLHKAKGQYAEAIKTLKQEIAVRRKLGQPDYPSSAEAMKVLGQAEFESKNQVRALNHLKDARSIYEKAGKTSDISYGEVLLNLGIVFRGMRKQQKCRDALFEALTVFKNTGCGSDHPLLSKTLAILREMGHRINI